MKHPCSRITCDDLGRDQPRSLRTVVAADAWFVAITGDADCGISVENTYTHKLDFGTGTPGALVNGVQFDAYNAAANGINNVEYHAVNLSGDVLHQPWMQSRYDRILLDPPRSGAADIVVQVGKLGVARIVYVACHPASLARDAGILVHELGYRLAAAGVMDMFPHTAHVESMAVFERQDG